jgi:hypothetical protein
MRLRCPFARGGLPGFVNHDEPHAPDSDIGGNRLFQSYQNLGEPRRVSRS